MKGEIRWYKGKYRVEIVLKSKGNYRVRVLDDFADLGNEALNLVDIIPSGLGYLYVYPTHKELPCGCVYRAIYQGCWVRIRVCEKHRKKEKETQKQ